VVFARGGQTTGVRFAPVPQLTCEGPADVCSQTDDLPQSAYCVHKGNDVWKCEAEMKHRFGPLEVLCEGYPTVDSADIVRGSCFLKYQLLVAAGRAAAPSQPASASAAAASTMTTTTTVVREETTSEPVAEVRRTRTAAGPVPPRDQHDSVLWVAFLALVGCLLVAALVVCLCPKGTLATAPPRSSPPPYCGEQEELHSWAAEAKGIPPPTPTAPVMRQECTSTNPCTSTTSATANAAAARQAQTNDVLFLFQPILDTFGLRLRKVADPVCLVGDTKAKTTTTTTMTITATPVPTAAAEHKGENRKEEGGATSQTGVRTGFASGGRR